MDIRSKITLNSRNPMVTLEEEACRHQTEGEVGKFQDQQPQMGFGEDLIKEAADSQEATLH